MNEPKRRGRPPKVAAGDGHIELVKKALEVPAPSEAQAYALRIWNGQSPDLSRHERLGRVAAALAAQGMSMEGVVL